MVGPGPLEICASETNLAFVRDFDVAASRVVKLEDRTWNDPEHITRTALVSCIYAQIVETVPWVKFTRVKSSNAPGPVRQTGKLTARMREYEEYVNMVKAGEAGRLTPEEGETARGLALRIARAAKRVGKTADTWVRDGDVYFVVS